MRKLILGLAATAAVAAPLALAAAPANAAGSPGCATRAEYTQIKNGMSPQRVAQILGTNGHVSYSYLGTYVFDLSRDYKPCQPFTEWSSVSVDFGKSHHSAPWHVTGKSSYWIS